MVKGSSPIRTLNTVGGGEENMNVDYQIIAEPMPTISLGTPVAEASMTHALPTN